MDRGSVMVIAALALTSLLLFAALVLDVGLVWVSRTQSQNADDSAAMAAAASMIQQKKTDPTTVNLAAARTDGARYAGSNGTVGEVPKGTTDLTGGVNVVPADFEFGLWDLTARKLDTTVDLTKPSNVTGVRVTVHMDGKANDKSPAFLSRLLGINGFAVKNTAIAYRGFQGEFGSGDFNLPVAIDSCKLSNQGCGQDYCETISKTPDACDLKWKQGTNPVTCLDFSPTKSQNACWTGFSDASGTGNNELEDLIDSGNANEMHVGDKAFVTNGSKTSVLKYLRNKFYGCEDNGKNCGKPGSPEPVGKDRYGPNPPHGNKLPPAPDIDSWVVKLPVFECQAGGAHCAGGSTMRINGGVCFEIREILAPNGDYDDSSALIKGRFLCPESPDAQERALFDEYCRDRNEDPGGCDFGLRTDNVVLVE